MKVIDLLKRPTGSVMAQRRIDEAQRRYISYLEASEEHANLSAHYLNEANRLKNQIEWLKECVKDFN